MKRTLSLILALILCLGALPFGALAADRKPVPKKITYTNGGEEPTLEVQYEDDQDHKWVELYLIGNEAKEGDEKGPMGLIDIDGKMYHLRGIQTIDASNKAQYYKDEKTGRWVAKSKVYVAGNPPAAGETIGVVIETGEDNGSMRKSKIIRMKVPATGKKTVYDDGEIGAIEIAFKANGGKGKMSSLVVYSGEKVTLPANTFTRAKYKFIAWNTKKNGSGKTYKDGAKVTLDKSTTLYAQWGKISLKLTKPTVRKGKKITLKAKVKAGGKALKGEEVTFTFAGKEYMAKTDSMGRAKVTVGASVTKALKAGKKVVVKASFGGVKVSMKVKVKK